MERPKELPRVIIDDQVRARVEARRRADQAVRANAAAFGGVALSFLQHLFSHGYGGGSITLRGGSSKRKPAEILGELNAFYAQRPRPWRPGGSSHRIRRNAYTPPKPRARFVATSGTTAHLREPDRRYEAA